MNVQRRAHVRLKRRNEPSRGLPGPVHATLRMELRGAEGARGDRAWEGDGQSKYMGILTAKKWRNGRWPESGQGSDPGGATGV